MSGPSNSTPATHSPPEAIGLAREHRAGDGILRWSIVLAAGLVLAASLMFVSVPQPPPALTEAVEAGDAPASLLRILKLLCLSYHVPTASGAEVKSLPIALGVACLAAIVAVGLILGGIRAGRPNVGGEPSADVRTDRTLRWLTQIEKVDLAQGLLALVVIWSVVSRAWSPAPELADRATVVLAIQAGWALLLSRGLAMFGGTGRTVRVIVGVLVASCFVSAVLMLRLHGLERWPVDSFFPIGRAQSSAACMVPALILAMAALAPWGVRVGRGSAEAGMARWVLHVLGLAGLVVVVAALGWSIVQSGSRAAWLGTWGGLLALVWLSVPRRARLVAGGLGLLLLVLAGLWTVGFARTSGSHEAADVRLSGYGSRYALGAWSQSRGTGFGQSGFMISPDPRPGAELVADPTALVRRWRGHVQSEWLEVLADLGLVGFHLTLGVYVLTLAGGLTALRSQLRGPEQRCLMAMLAAVVGMFVSECMGSALRSEPLPAVWYTVLGGTWALILIARRRSRPVVPALAGRLAGGVAMVLAGLAAAGLGWRSLQGEVALTEAQRLLVTRQADRALELAHQGKAQSLQPGAQGRARLTAARAHYRLATAGMIELARQSAEAATALRTATSQPGSSTQEAPTSATRPADLSPADRRASIAAWRTPAFRATWDLAERHLRLALSALRDVEGILPTFPGRLSLEAEVCQTLSGLWQLRGNLAGAGQERVVRDARDLAGGYQRRQMAALLAAVERQPLSETALINLLRVSRDLPLARVIDWLRRPLRNPLVSDEYRSVVLQVSTRAGFQREFAPFWRRAMDDATMVDNREWSDPFSPETLRLGAIIMTAEYKIDQAIGALTQALGLYRTAHYRLAAQQSRTMADLGWLRLVAQPTQPQLALATLQEALVVSEQPQFDPSLRPVYRRVMHVLLALGDEASARQVLPMVSDRLARRSPDRVVGWSYEVLARTFHRLPPDRRPPGWPRWVDRALELDPNSPDVLTLSGIRAAEERDSRRAAESLARAWRRSTSIQQQQECLRAIAYAISRNPNSHRLKYLSRQIEQRLRATTQRAAAGPATSPSRPVGNAPARH